MFADRLYVHESPEHDPTQTMSGWSSSQLPEPPGLLQSHQSIVANGGLSPRRSPTPGLGPIRVKARLSHPSPARREDEKSIPLRQGMPCPTTPLLIQKHQKSTTFTSTSLLRCVNESPLRPRLAPGERFPFSPSTTKRRYLNVTAPRHKPRFNDPGS